MAQSSDPFSGESEAVLDAFEQRGLIDDELADRIDRLREEGEPMEALELLLSHRRGLRSRRAAPGDD